MVVWESYLSDGLISAGLLLNLTHIFDGVSLMPAIPLLLVSILLLYALYHRTHRAIVGVISLVLITAGWLIGLYLFVGDGSSFLIFSSSWALFFIRRLNEMMNPNVIYENAGRRLLISAPLVIATQIFLSNGQSFSSLCLVLSVILSILYIRHADQMRHKGNSLSSPVRIRYPLLIVTSLALLLLALAWGNRDVILFVGYTALTMFLRVVFYPAPWIIHWLQSLHLFSYASEQVQPFGTPSMVNSQDAIMQQDLTFWVSTLVKMIGASLIVYLLWRKLLIGVQPLNDYSDSSSVSRSRVPSRRPRVGSKSYSSLQRLFVSYRRFSTQRHHFIEHPSLTARQLAQIPRDQSERDFSCALAHLYELERYGKKETDESKVLALQQQFDQLVANRSDRERG